MKKKLKFLLLQARKENDLMITNELNCFSRILKTNKDLFTIKDLTRDKIKESYIKKFDVVLVGGSGDYSVAHGGYFMKQTLNIMQYLVSSSKETFASCWGFQAIAKAMGGEVVHDLKLAELGTISLKLTNEGKKDPIFGKMPNTFFCQMGHEDIVIKKPKDSIILASSKRIKIEAFRFKEKPIYCTQFHPELRVEDLKIRMNTYPKYVEKILGISQQEFIENRCFEAKETELLLTRFINFYFS